VTASGKSLKGYPHKRRWNTFRAAYNSRESLYQLRYDDPRFDLKAGDLLVTVPYRYDSKVTVLRRLSDGYDPECNQYLSNVTWIGWAKDYSGIELANRGTA